MVIRYIYMTVEFYKGYRCTARVHLISVTNRNTGILVHVMHEYKANISILLSINLLWN